MVKNRGDDGLIVRGGKQRYPTAINIQLEIEAAFEPVKWTKKLE